MYNNGAMVHLDAGSVVQVNGSLENSAQGTCENFGELTVSNNITLSDYSKANGDGVYRLQGDWINNALFTSDESEVIMDGGDQWVTGNTISSFYDLTLESNGIKYLALNSTVSGTLDLQDRELATLGNVMQVLNSASSAIQRTSGFVSSTVGGYLERTCNSVSTYVFPLGSSEGTTRYRPLEVVPDANTNRFAGRFINNDASIDSRSVNTKSDEICLVNDAWYHEFKRLSGGSEVDLAVFYDPSTDGDFNSITNWDEEWKYTDTALVGLDYVQLQSWSSFHNEFYALSNEQPRLPEITSDTLFCEGQILTVEASGGNEGEYIWNLEGGSIVSGDLTSSSIEVEWDLGQSNLIYVTVLRNACSSGRSDTIYVSSASVPDVAFTYENVGYGLNDFVFTSLLNNDMTLDWGFDGYEVYDGDSVQFREYEFEGDYIVSLTATSALGCQGVFIDTISYNDTLSVTNTFTPNEDGINDVWVALFPENTEWTVKIYNRWGELVRSKESGIYGEILWDGKTDAGSDVSAGVYYYILNLHDHEDDSKESLNGYVTLLR
jgi:gliding motility-associated-like protein